MSEESGRDAPRRVKAGLIDVTVPNAARAADFLHGGKGNFAADREDAPPSPSPPRRSSASPPRPAPSVTG